MSTDLLNDVAELSKWDVFKRLGWRAHRAQREVLASPARIKVVSAGRRFGKSEIGGHELVPEALATFNYSELLRENGKRREFWIVGPEYSDSEKEFRIAYNELKKLEVPFDKPGTYNDPLGGNMHMSLWGGTCQIHAKSAKHPETLVGEGLSGVILAEAAKLKHKVWVKYIRPTLADFGGWCNMVSTPEGKNWYYEAWQNGRNPHMPDWYSVRLPSWRNPYVYRKHTTDEQVAEIQGLMRQVIGTRYRSASELVQMFALDIDDEIVSLLDDLTEESFNQEIGADFSEFVGRVFKEFDEDTHVADLDFNPKWATFGATDYGFTNPNVWLLIQLGPWDEVHVLDEVYERGLTPDEFANEIKRRGLSPFGIRGFYPDPEDPGATRTLENILHVRHSGGTGGELNDRINGIREALRRVPGWLPEDHPESLPTLRINRKCKNLIREMQDYRYPDTKEEAKNNEEKPMKKDDHTPEALGRFFAGYFGTPTAQGGRTRVHKADIGRKHNRKYPLPPGATLTPDGFVQYPNSRPPDHGMIHPQLATPEQLRSTPKRDWSKGR